MAPSKTMKKHDGLVYRLESELITEPCEIWKFLEYCKRDYKIEDLIKDGDYRHVSNPLGEIDLLRYYHGIWEFYEIKAGKRHKIKARQQYRRFMRQFYNYPTRGFLYTTDGLRRI